MITGRNGAGKSSLLDILAGRLHPEAGAIRLEDAGERTLPECLHYVGHRDALKSALTAEENLAFARDFLGNPALTAREALDAVGLAHAARLPVAYLSAGQRRRVALARLLVAHRPLWLLDEPTAALDTASQETLRLILERHRESGGMIAATTHSPLFLQDAKEIRIERLLPPPSAGEGAERSEAGGGPSFKSGRPLSRPSGPPSPAPKSGVPDLGIKKVWIGNTRSRWGRGQKGRGSMIRSFNALLIRDLKLAARVGGSGVMGLIFFLMIVTLIPFALGPDLNLLSRIGPAILWIAALLATLIGLDRLFQADQEDGSLDLLRLSHAPLEIVVLAKVLAYWLVTGLPLAIAAPFLGLLVALSPEGMLAMVATLLVGTPALTFIGAVGAALTSSLRRGGLILAILVLPFMIPTLIFGVSAANAALGGTIPFMTPFLVLVALSLIAAVVGTVGAAAALRSGE